jgi:hypothetical protein
MRQPAGPLQDRVPPEATRADRDRTQGLRPARRLAQAIPESGTRTCMAVSELSGRLPRTCLNSCWPPCVQQANDWCIAQKRRSMPRIAVDPSLALTNVHHEIVRDEGTAISERSPATTSRMRAEKARPAVRSIRPTGPSGKLSLFRPPTQPLESALHVQSRLQGGRA